MPKHGKTVLRNYKSIYFDFAAKCCDLIYIDAGG